MCNKMLFDPFLSDEIESGIPATSLYRLIHDVYVLLDNADRSVLAQFDLTPSQYRVLMLMHPFEGRRLTDLSYRMLFARSTITRLMDQMEAAGLVHRVTDPDDRRAQRVALTAAGADLRLRAYTAHEQYITECFARRPAPEQEQLIQLLKHLRTSLRIHLGIQDT